MDLNKQYASLATEYLQNEKKDLIWVHDTYLLLVPFYLRTLNINANIGLSMHSPFPSSDIYKTFPFRAEVLKSMMCSDLISFHVYDYVKHFLTTVNRILGCGTIFKKGGFIAVSSHGREVMLRVSHIAIEVSDIHDAMDSSEFLKCKKLLSNQIPEMRGKYIISSYDRSHPISGIRQKLQAFQGFLEKFPRYRTKVCLVQFMVPYNCC